MSEPLDIVLKAHGGLDRWSKIQSIRVDASITGAIWFVKGKPDVLKDVVITGETKQERLTMEFRGQDKRTVFEPDHVAIQNEQGKLIEESSDPRKSFEGQTPRNALGRHACRLFQRRGDVDLPQRPLPIRAAGIRDRGDRPRPIGRRKVAEVEDQLRSKGRRSRRRFYDRTTNERSGRLDRVQRPGI